MTNLPSFIDKHFLRRSVYQTGQKRKGKNPIIPRTPSFRPPAAEPGVLLCEAGCSDGTPAALFHTPIQGPPRQCDHNLYVNIATPLESLLTAQVSR